MRESIRRAAPPSAAKPEPGLRSRRRLCPSRRSSRRPAARRAPAAHRAPGGSSPTARALCGTVRGGEPSVRSMSAAVRATAGTRESAGREQRGGGGDAASRLGEQHERFLERGHSPLRGWRVAGGARRVAPQRAGRGRHRGLRLTSLAAAGLPAHPAPAVRARRVGPLLHRLLLAGIFVRRDGALPRAQQATPHVKTSSLKRLHLLQQEAREILRVGSA